jgi:hypothetical protein
MAVLSFIISLLIISQDFNIHKPCSEDDIPELLISYGFENIEVSRSSGTLMVKYENRVYFREKDAISIITRAVMDSMPDVQTLVLVPKMDNTPIFQVSISRDQYISSGKKITGSIQKLYIKTPLAYYLNLRQRNPTIGKTDIIINPVLDSVFGHFEDPFIYRFAVSPEILTFWGRGIRSRIRLRFLIHDDTGHQSDRLTLDGLNLDYVYRSSNPVLLNLTGGYLGRNLYGLASEALFFGYKGLSGIGISAARLGNVYYWDNTIYYTEMWKWTALLNLYQSVPFWDVLLTARFGRFLYRDYGISGEITRFFHNTGISIFAARTESGSIGGFEVKFLLYPHRHPVPRFIRLRLPTIMDFQYRYLENDVGVIFSPGYSIDYGTKRFWLMNLN